MSHAEGDDEKIIGGLEEGIGEEDGSSGSELGNVSIYSTLIS